jgi:hypothetical protein
MRTSALASPLALAGRMAGGMLMEAMSCPSPWRPMVPSQGWSMPAFVRPGFDGYRSRNATAAGVACCWIQVPKSSRR